MKVFAIGEAAKYIMNMKPSGPPPPLKVVGADPAAAGVVADPAAVVINLFASSGSD